MIRNIFFAIIAAYALLAESSALMTPRSIRNADTCGVPIVESGLIVNGQNFPRGSFPWIVALMHRGFRPPKFFCAGTLISKTFAISAAHCILQKHASKEFLPREVLASFGAHDLSDTHEAWRYHLSPKRIYIHDDWNPSTSEYDADVSLLEFEARSIHFNDFVQPICLWNSENEPTATEGVVVGWGKSEDATKDHENIPRLVKAPIQSNEECFFDGGQRLLDLSSRRTFCAGLRNGSGVCQGDSGGGLFIKVEEVFHLKGIVSSSLIKDDGCDVSKNAVYTNVLKFKAWIGDIVGDVQSSLEKVFCIFEITRYYERQFNSCKVNQTIDSEDFVLGSPRNTSIEMFSVIDNRNVKFLPRLVGEKLPNLEIFDAGYCGLTIVRDFYFKNMRSLELLGLDRNQITTIEPNAFDDLVSLQWLNLDDNRIETLDEKLFVKLIKLTAINLNANKIKFLSPTTFNIPGNAKLDYVHLRGNVCIDKLYGSRNGDLNQLESDVRANCTQ